MSVQSKMFYKVENHLLPPYKACCAVTVAGNWALFLEAIRTSKQRNLVTQRKKVVTCFENYSFSKFQVFYFGKTRLLFSKHFHEVVFLKPIL